MNSATPALPEFDRPPIVEAVLSIQFAAPANFRSVHAGLIWDEIRRDYPTVSEQRPLAPVFETFGIPTIPGPGVRFEPLLATPMARFWFESDDSRHLLQIQQDRIVHNWRKRTLDDEYPRYQAVRKRFAEEVKILEGFLTRNGLDGLMPNQCEMTYLNFVTLPDGANPHQNLSRVTRFCSDCQAPELERPFQGAALEGCSFAARYIKIYNERDCN